MNFVATAMKPSSMFITVLILLSLAAIPTHASFSIDQQLIEVQARHGESLVRVIRVTNFSDEPMNISVKPADYIRDADGNVYTPDVGENEYSLFPYVSLSSTYISLEPHGSYDLEYAINFPEEVEGSRWLALYFEPDIEPITPRGADPDQANFSIQVVIAYRTLLLATVTGTEAPDGTITGIRAAREPSLCFEVDLLNTGNVYYRATGWLDIRDEQGATVTTMPIDRSFVLPDQTLTIQVADDELDLAPGRYLALAVVDFGGDQLVAGQLIFDVD